MTTQFNTTDLEAYLDESLDVQQMTAIESALRQDPNLLRRLTQLLSQRDLANHSVAAIWRRHRLSCPTREELGRLLLDLLETAHRDYVYFHVTEIGCRMCQANLRDLEDQQKQADPASYQRRRRYFQSSAGLLPHGGK